MPLTCDCGENGDPGAVLWYSPEKYESLSTTKRKRCNSCGQLINIGDLCTVSRRVKIPEYEIEIAIYGEDGEIERADGHMCESCSDIFFSLQELGFCVGAWEDQHELLKDYHDVYGK